MSNRTETKEETRNRLFKENGLLKEDFFTHSQFTIITRSGIEKIQYKNNVTVKFDVVVMSPEFCVVKAIATKEVDGKTIIIETFGSAGHNANGEYTKNKQYQYLYYPELSEKRALSRAVLKITNFYELGVFGEDESPDFKKDESTPNTNTQPAPQRSPQQPVMSKQEADNKVNGVNQGFEEGERPITIKQKTDLLLLLNNSVIKKEEKERMVAKIKGFSEERVEEAIAKLKKVIKERTNPDPYEAKPE